MSRKFGRRPDESAGPEQMRCLTGELGPWVASDKAEFHHAGREAQEWFLRLDAGDVAKHQDAAKFVSSVRTAQKWAWRVWWAFTVGLGAALTAGENLQKLPSMISGVLSLIRGLW